MVAEVNKPDFSYVWASGGAIVMPSNVKTQTGWTAEVPPFQWENALQNRQDNAIVHLFQKGISEWDIASNYYFTTNGTRSYVQGSDGVIYVAVQDSLGQNPTTDLSDTYWKVAFASAEAGYLTQTAGDARYTQRANNLSDLTNSATARTNLSVYSSTQTDSAISLAPSIQGVFSNLRVSTTGLSALVSLTARSITVGIPGGSTKTLDNISLPSISLTTNGVNGLDVGISTASTWYSVWVIWNGTTTGGLLSLSATAPTLPSGYTRYARVGWVRTDSTANKYPLGMTQAGNIVRYKISPGTNVTATPVMASGVAGSATGGTYVAVGTPTFIPPTAQIISITMVSGGGSAAAAQSLGFGPTNTSVNPPPINSASAGNNASMGSLILESSNIYWAADTGGGRLLCTGWEDNL